jgi:transposase-like protein
MPRTHRTYEKDFRQEAVNLLLSSGRPLKRVAVELGISANSLRTWRDRALGKGRAAEAASPQAKGRSAAPIADAAGEIRRLQREVDYLRRQREILKKAWAYSPRSRRAVCVDWLHAALLRHQYGKGLLRKRGQHIERSFAHVLDAGGMRRATLRGLENLNKRHQIAAACYNLSQLLRRLYGIGTPKQWRASLALFLASMLTLVIVGFRSLVTGARKCVLRVFRDFPHGQSDGSNPASSSTVC